MPTEALGVTVDAVPDSIPVARGAVVEYAKACNADTDRVALAASEALTNVVRHAYRDGSPGPLRLEAAIERSDLIVTVADEGAGITPRLDSPGAGIGLALIATMAADVRLENSPAGLTVSMRFPCAGED